MTLRPLNDIVSELRRQQLHVPVPALVICELAVHLQDIATRLTAIEARHTAVDEIEHARMDDDGAPPVSEERAAIAHAWGKHQQEERHTERDSKPEIVNFNAPGGWHYLYWNGHELKRGLRVEVNDVPPTTRSCPPGWYTIVGVRPVEKMVQVRGEPLPRPYDTGTAPLFWISAERILCLGRTTEEVA